MLLLVVMFRIKPIIANHLKVFLRDMADQPGNKIQNGNSFNNELIILMAVVMKGNRRPIVRIDTRGSNDRSAKVTADIFDGMVSSTGMGFSSDIKAIVQPLGQAEPVSDVVPLKEDLLLGYQTMDGIGGILMTMMLISSAHSHGFTDKKEVSGMIAKAGIISCVLLMLVYGGLAYLGAMTSSLGLDQLSQAELLTYIITRLLGNTGMAVLAVIVFLACLTMAVSLTAIAANFFCEFTHGRIKYTYLVVGMLAFRYLFSNLGLSAIISISTPILSLLYPPVLVLVLMTFFDGVLKTRWPACFAAYTALVFGVLNLQSPHIGALQILNALPFAKYGLGWILPSAVGGAAGAVYARLQGKKLLGGY